jgi:hypothetical protein
MQNKPGFNTAGILGVWVRERPLPLKSSIDRFRQDEIKWRDQHNESTDETWNEYFYRQTLWKIDRINNKITSISSISYDLMGNVLASFNYDNDNWVYVTPDSFGEEIFDAAVKHFYKIIK